MGDATMKAYNVVPEQGSVQVRGEIDWPSDLFVRVNIGLF